MRLQRAARAAQVRRAAQLQQVPRREPPSRRLRFRSLEPMWVWLSAVFWLVSLLLPLRRVCSRLVHRYKCTRMRGRERCVLLFCSTNGWSSYGSSNSMRRSVLELYKFLNEEVTFV